MLNGSKGEIKANTATITRGGSVGKHGTVLCSREHCPYHTQLTLNNYRA
ncbi:hypothetical protein KHA80_13135 [Anaerobacillus sp. HL2]|nr:hypothetical protein KHA80_13135 [Anaerobacillus sp. HL2]